MTDSSRAEGRGLRGRLPKRQTILTVLILFGVVNWAVERLAEFSWIETRYLYDPTTDSVFVIGKAVLLESLELQDWVPFSDVPKTSIAWVEPWRLTVGEQLAELASSANQGQHDPEGRSLRPQVVVDSIGGGATRRAGYRWDAAFVEDATVSDPARHLPAPLLQQLPPLDDDDFWHDVVPVHATVISYGWTAITLGESVRVEQQAPRSRVIAPAILFRRSAARVFAAEVQQGLPVHRGFRIDVDGEWPVLSATGPPP